LLQHHGVISLEELKAIRRANVARLLDEYGQTRLSELTGIAPALLYQLGRAKGKSQRNVSDRHARAIEQALGLSPGWMDIDHDRGLEVREPAAPPPLPSEDRWPFRFAYARFARLSPSQKERIEEVVEGMVLRFEARNQASARKSSSKQRPVAG